MLLNDELKTKWLDEMVTNRTQLRADVAKWTFNDASVENRNKVKKAFATQLFGGGLTPLQRVFKDEMHMERFLNHPSISEFKSQFQYLAKREQKGPSGLARM